MILFPNAKINIGLSVTQRRPDGYHDLETLFYPVPWYDILEIVPASGSDTTLTVSGRDVDCPVEKNLIMKAYHALSKRMLIPPVDIFLRKVIPDGAGLGGGSSDAAFTLTGLNELFKLGLSKEELADTAAGIGADCPFFIYNTPMFATGIGNIFTPAAIDLSGMAIAIVKPPVSVLTKEAYSGVIPAMPVCGLPSLIAEPVNCWRDIVVNDFEKSIFAAHPEIAIAKEKLYSLGASYASMSGSGAAVYGLFGKMSDRLADTATKMFPGCDTMVATLS